MRRGKGGEDQRSHQVSDGEAFRAAQAYYLAGEAQYAKQLFPEAAALWKRAVVSLPRRAEYDGLRHELLLRVGHGQLMSFAATGDSAYLDEGVEMLEAYLKSHEQLFGDDPKRQAARTQVYELVGDMGVAQENLDAAQDLLPAPLTEEDEVALAQVDAHSGENLEAAGIQREVHVPTRTRTDVNDPKTRAKLKSSFSAGSAGGVLTAAGTMTYEPRALIRMSRRPTSVSGASPKQARQIARSVLAAGRPALEACYGTHLASIGELADVDLQVSVGADGAVREAAVLVGELGGPEARACILTSLEAVQVQARDSAPATVSLPLRFFLDVPKPIYEMAVQPFGPGDRGDPATGM